MVKSIEVVAARGKKKKMTITKLIRRVRAWRSEEKLINDLLSRSDHELRDIGIARGDIARVIKR